MIKYNYEACTDQFFLFLSYFKEIKQCFKDWQLWMTRNDIHKFRYHYWSYHDSKLGFYYPFWTSINQGAFDMYAEFHDV